MEILNICVYSCVFVLAIRIVYVGLSTFYSNRNLKRIERKNKLRDSLANQYPIFFDKNNWKLLLPSKEDFGFPVEPYLVRLHCGLQHNISGLSFIQPYSKYSSDSLYCDTEINFKAMFSDEEHKVIQSFLYEVRDYLMKQYVLTYNDEIAKQKELFRAKINCVDVS